MRSVFSLMPMNRHLQKINACVWS